MIVATNWTIERASKLRQCRSPWKTVTTPQSNNHEWLRLTVNDYWLWYRCFLQRRRRHRRQGKRARLGSPVFKFKDTACTRRVEQVATNCSIVSRQIEQVFTKQACQHEDTKKDFSLCHHKSFVFHHGGRTRTPEHSYDGLVPDFVPMIVQQQPMTTSSSPSISCPSNDVMEKFIAYTKFLASWNHAKP